MSFISQNLRVGQGEVWSCTACFADVSLQLLIHQQIVMTMFFNPYASCKYIGVDMLVSRPVISFCMHTTHALCPMQRDNTNSIVAGATQEEHAITCLEHHRQAVEIVTILNTIHRATTTRCSSRISHYCIHPLRLQQSASKL